MLSRKPEGYSTISAYLVVAGAQRVIDFLKNVFGASELRRYDMPDGSIMHAELRIGVTVVMIGDAGGEWPEFPSWPHVYVAGVGSFVEAALLKANFAGRIWLPTNPIKPADSTIRGNGT